MNQSKGKKDRPYTSNLRGVSALLGTPTAQLSESATATSQSVAIDRISLPAQQPRRYFDPLKLNQLAESVKQHGILEPLLVRKKGDYYELIAGERRYRAAQIVELREVPIVVLDVSDEEALQLALVENLQREDLNPIEEAEGILQLLSLHLTKPVDEVVVLLHRMQNEARGKVTQNVLSNSESELVQDLFSKLGLITWESFVTTRLALLNLPEEILEALRSGKIAYTKAQAIARIKDPDQRQQLLEDAIAGDWSLSQIKEKIAALRSTPKESEESDTSTLFESAKLITSFLKKKRTLEPQKQKRAEELMAELRSLFSGE